MASRRVPVSFEPSGLTAWVAPGTSVLSAARSVGLLLNAPCGGRGICGGCAVKVLEGALQAPGATELSGLSRAPKGVRLACHALVEGPVRVKPSIPAQTGPAPAAPLSGSLVAGVDLGTTGVAAVLIDPRSGAELARATAPNEQAAWGADVLSRISAASAGHGDELATAAWRSIAAALAAAGVPDEGLARLVIAGNSAMVALAAGVDASSLGVAPFSAPVIPEDATDVARASGLLAEAGSASFVGPLASFVGGDTVAAIAATGLAGADEPVMLVDLGTNAEVALRARGSVTVTSAPAGPAFEGGGLRCAGPALPGAVTRVRVQGSELALEVLGSAEPLWLAGSGVVSVIAALRDAGHIGADGLMHASGPLSDRFRTDDDGVVRIRLTDGGAEAAVELTQLDVRAFQLAKAAVRVAVDGVLKATRTKPRGVTRVDVAGAFGAALDPDDLVELGVVPDEFRDRINAVGNASLAGAAAFALESEAQAETMSALQGAEHVELAADAGFNDALMRATELKRS